MIEGYLLYRKEHIVRTIITHVVFGIGFGLLVHPSFTPYRLHGIFLILLSLAEHAGALLKSREYGKYYKNIKNAMLFMRSRKSYK